MFLAEVALKRCLYMQLLIEQSASDLFCTSGHRSGGSVVTVPRILSVRSDGITTGPTRNTELVPLPLSQPTAGMTTSLQLASAAWTAGPSSWTPSAFAPCSHTEQVLLRRFEVAERGHDGDRTVGGAAPSSLFAAALVGLLLDHVKCSSSPGRLFGANLGTTPARPSPASENSSSSSSSSTTSSG